mgnify:CR=1 FL=1
MTNQLSQAEQLTPEAYHQTVGPSLKAAADIAAKRGHPTLHDDLPCMIALVELVSRLVDLYADTRALTEHERGVLDAAPLGAAVMVLGEAGLDADTIAVMRDALRDAHSRVHDQGIIDDPRPTVAMAWSYLMDAKREAADNYLQRSVLAMAEAIDAWEAAPQSE